MRERYKQCEVSLSPLNHREALERRDASAVVYIIHLRDPSILHFRRCNFTEGLRL
jgi:hypothetical protein